jgi:hypothetical protein
MNKLIFGVLISFLFLACQDKAEEKPSTTEATLSSNESQKGGDQFLPMSDADGVKRSLQAFSQGDIDAMSAEYADTVFQLWSGLDSLRGKKAIQDYYKGRWALIDSLNFSDFVFVPLQMNAQQTPYAPTGKWILAWVFAHVKYKNGKKLDFWFHNVYHYNADSKIDFIGQYIDRQPLIEASKNSVKS